MGSVELSSSGITIYSHILTYGHAADTAITSMIRDEIEMMWNEPAGIIRLGQQDFPVRFRITAAYAPLLTDIEIYENLDPRNNYFRIEAFAQGKISFVDGLGCNTGYFLLENLYKGSTTAAHEYGHTLGLDHPHDLDIRGQGVPGIMYPRGTWVDPEFQYDPAKAPGTNGGTLYPIHRKVLKSDIAALQLHRLDFRSGKAILGDFTSVWHPDHSTLFTRDDL